MLASYATQVIRTTSSYLIGALASFLLARFAISMPENTKNWAIATLVFLIGTAYYLLVSAVERRWPAAGWLLGKPVRPVYAAPVTANPATDPAAAQLAVAVTELPNQQSFTSQPATLPDSQSAALAAAVTGPL